MAGSTGPVKCGVDGCDTVVRAKSLCYKHYMRLKRTGTTDTLKEFHGHGGRGGRSPTYVTWRAMRSRCKYSCVDRYPSYGGRGIAVCDRWMNSFPAFLADMGERPAGTSLDRIDANGHYEPGNCRWASIDTQSNNKTVNRNLMIYGKTMTVKQWHGIVSHEISCRAVYSRLDRGWSHKEAIFGKASA